MVMRFHSSCALILGAGLTLTSSVSAQRRVPVERTALGELTEAGIAESSGIAVSRRYAGVLWTHNDSGDDPVLYALSLTGHLLARYRVVGARAVDWEDISLGPCPDPGMGPSCLFIADTGDNQERRTRVIIYVVPQPDPTTDGAALRETQPAHALRVRYHDGPRDAEAIAVRPDGVVMIITKGRSGPVLRYEISPSELLGDSLVLVPVDTMPIDPQPLRGRWVTGAAVSPSGERAVIGTHTELYFFERSASGWRLDGAGCWLGFPLRQYEAVDFLDEEFVVVTSEKTPGADGVIHKLRC